MKILSQFLSSIVVVSVFLTDRVSKGWVMEHMFLGESIPVLPFFYITHIHNTGIAFGVGQDQNKFFTYMGLALLVALLILRHHWQRQYGGNTWLKAGLALVIGGAVGNLYDRIVYGSVIDFLDFFVGDYHWPAFNVADSAICVGAVLLIVTQWKEKPSDAQPSAGEAQKSTSAPPAHP